MLPSITRRNALALLGAATQTRLPAAEPDLNIAPGPFQGTRESLRSYRIPEWFRDAKFGIWAHWGPQSAIEAGDWYARNMYMQGSDQYKYHLENYGHPSKVGFKDTIPNWKAAKWDPDHLIGLYKKAGAKYFFSMGVHHDNFDLWNSKYTRWNSVKMGPRRDVVGGWAKAARKHGLKFGVSEHLWITYKWFSVSHGSDKDGQYAGVPYDGANSANFDLYTDDKTVYTKLPWNEDGITEEWKRHWYLRIKDLIDQYQPDMLYTDGALPFERYGCSVVANLYNSSAKRHGGKTEAVYFSKRAEDCSSGVCALDVERGIVENIWPDPWQTDTCIGNWHYKRDIQYKSPKTVIDMLVDIVSRNGNLLLNFPLPNSGELDPAEMNVLSEITEWMAVNGEAIYSTRPWRIFGEGPSSKQASSGDAKFNESKRTALTSEDVRFTKKGDTLFAFVMGVPDREAGIPALRFEAQNQVGKIQNVELLGHPGKLQWTQDARALTVQLPEAKPCRHALAFKVLGT